MNYQKFSYYISSTSTLQDVLSLDERNHSPFHSLTDLAFLNAASSVSKGSNSALISRSAAPAHLQVQISVLKLITVVARHPDIMSSQIRKLSLYTGRFLSQQCHELLQETARVMFRSLGAIDSDLVWWQLAQYGKLQPRNLISKWPFASFLSWRPEVNHTVAARLQLQCPWLLSNTTDESAPAAPTALLADSKYETNVASALIELQSSPELVYPNSTHYRLSDIQINRYTLLPYNTNTLLHSRMGSLYDSTSVPSIIY